MPLAVHGRSRSGGLSADVNASNRRACVAASMPSPVSETRTVQPMRPSSRALAARWTPTSPKRVNFTALETRLETHWRTRTGS